MAVPRHPWGSILWQKSRQRLLGLAVLLAAAGFLEVTVFPPDVPHRRESSRPPKVAFLFITRNSMPLDFLWDQFFKNADPRRPYSVYIHAIPGTTFNSSVTSCNAFLNREIPDSTVVKWGRMSMVDAERLLLRHALKDRLNQRFIFLSESCLFLHEYNYIYDYLIFSSKSFVDSFREGKQGTDKRYNPLMSPKVTLQSWRKGSQWVMLMRKHAHTVASETAVYNVFEKHCKPAFVFLQQMKEEGLTVGNKSLINCIPDEHYVQVLAVIKWKADEVQRRSLTYSEWQGGEGTTNLHPVTFNETQLTPRKLVAMQTIEKIKYDGEGRTEICSTPEDPRPCFLFARKISKSGGLKILKEMPAVIGLRSQS